MTRPIWPARNVDAPREWRIAYELGNPSSAPDGWNLVVSVSDLDTAEDRLMVTVVSSDSAVLESAGISVERTAPGSRTIHIPATAVVGHGDAILKVTVAEPGIGKQPGLKISTNIDFTAEPVSTTPTSTPTSTATTTEHPLIKIDIEKFSGTWGRTPDIGIGSCPNGARSVGSKIDKSGAIYSVAISSCARVKVRRRCPGTLCACPCGYLACSQTHINLTPCFGSTQGFYSVRTLRHIGQNVRQVR